MSTAVSGIHANVFVGATDLDAQGWSADFEVNTFDSTTTADAGWEDVTASTQKASGTVDILYNESKKPNTIVNQGSTIALVLWVNNPGGDKYSGNALVTKLAVKNKTKDGFTVAVSWVNKGAWTMPA